MAKLEMGLNELFRIETVRKAFLSTHLDNFATYRIRAAPLVTLNS